jgi:D-glycero-D-manno-heptose 1,7-bisphosphate phosphatase
VINVDHGYVHRVDQFEFVPGILQLVRFAVHDLGWPVIVVTNQSGIGRGYFDEAAFQALTAWMSDRFIAEGAPLARVYHCPYHPEHGVGRYRGDHPWRKPKPGMFLQAAADLDLDLPRSVMIGDRMDDMVAAAAAGIKSRIRVDVNENAHKGALPKHRVVRDLAEALDVLRTQIKSDMNRTM